MARMPTVFIPHGGGPCFFMDWNPPDEWDRHRQFLRSLTGTLPERPKALLVISGHWEERAFTVQTNPAPPLLFDYGGFPPHTYELSWPAPGDPVLADRVHHLIRAAGLPAAKDTARGFDHGAFVPLKVAFPDADVPCACQRSRSRTPYRAGSSLGAPARRGRADHRQRQHLSQHGCDDAQPAPRTTGGHCRRHVRRLTDRGGDLPGCRGTKPQADALVQSTRRARCTSQRRAPDPAACRSRRGGCRYRPEDPGRSRSWCRRKRLSVRLTEKRSTTQCPTPPKAPSS
ncbi:4,5-DOPA dioxygenase extradiol (plasmid) [Nitratireductor thuwali]|uniref:4,5-DOPA dioxygenase extradiol n=1 Tax=Nitratireductor thuwali TaxID=2267699 RepID=A0ABY5MRK6_9HYPH|nr:4,5-DOPA dioxygenase extradiol [Nitratireductor thuwali]